MDTERELRTEFRRALDDVLPPVPWLETAVTDHLRKRRLHRRVDRRPGQSRQKKTALPRPAIQFAVGVLIVVLAAVASFLELRYHAPQSTPAGAITVQAYQAMVSQDDGELIVARSPDCSTLQPPCPGGRRQALAALQRWLDDLDRSVPPTRFAQIDAQLRGHLAANVSQTLAVFAAYHANDQSGLDRMNYATKMGAYWLDEVALSIGNSHQGTVPAYIASVRVGEQNLGSCTSCLSLGGNDHIVCAGDQAMSCLFTIGYAESVIGEFQASLVRVAGPDAITAKDALLQRDLAEADTALIRLTTASLTGEQAVFDAARTSLRQALAAVNADIANILEAPEF